MDPKGMFKLLFWLAPVTALIYFYITQKQNEQVADMKFEKATFDEDWNRMNEEFSRGMGDSRAAGEWAEAKRVSGEKVIKAKEKAEMEEMISDKQEQEMREELSSINAENYIQNHKK